MAASLKIGVLTFHRCINYGSYWQARCLVEGLRDLGHDAVLLDYFDARADWAEWRCALQPLLPARTRREDHPLYVAKIRKFFDAVSLLPLSPRFALDDPAAMPPCDLVLIGSDEVWNLQHPWYGQYPAFFGERLRAQRVVAYAASFGSFSCADGLRGLWANKLAALDDISVRDENSRRLISDVLDRDPALVLDPCLQFPNIIPPFSEPREQPYMLCYGHSFPDWFGCAVREWAAAKHYRFVSVGYRNDCADEQRIAAGPEEFAQLMSGAAAIATNFFHGCVFSLLHGKPFVCAPSEYRSNKVRDLAALVGAQRHLVSEATPPEHYVKLLEASPDAAIMQRITALRASSNAYLSHVLD
jgi:hypothetical protein